MDNEQLNTESESNYQNIDKMSVKDLLKNINAEDKKVADAVEKSIPSIIILIKNIVNRMKDGGRLFYIGSGTSGRLGVVDASECPPTFGVTKDKIIGIIAGGDHAIRQAVEFAEDDTQQAWQDMMLHKPNTKDVVIGISASGKTPYVFGAVQKAKSNKLLTACITCNLHTLLAKTVDCPIEVIVGAEFVTGSTRMKAGTAQKMVLNMISTAVMVQLGKVRGNKMVDMQLSNAKLVKRGTNILMDELHLSEEEAKKILCTHPSVRKAIENYRDK